MNNDSYYVHKYVLFVIVLGHIIMNTSQTKLARKQLEKRLAPLRHISFVMPPRGWVKAIREELGMTARQLATRMEASPSRIPAIEKAEVTGSTTIKTLREVANAMNCTLVYAFVPNRPLDDLLSERAKYKAKLEVRRLDHTMRLENQVLHKTDLEDEQQRLINLALSGSLRGLWEDE